jgi:hypothetical protein
MWFLQIFAQACEETRFFGIRPWYKYLNDADRLNAACELRGGFFTGPADNQTLDLGVLTLAGLGILDILLRLAALIAVGFVVYGGIKYVVSQGESDKTKGALKTITNALIGLGITVFAVALVAFIGNVLLS